MTAQSSVTVYNFRFYDQSSQMMRVSRYKAARTTIAERFDGEVLEGTGHDVPADELDEHGRYRRRATGWGELN